MLRVNDMFPMTRRDARDPTHLEVWHTGTNTFHKVTDPEYGTEAWMQRLRSN
jgi:hypothetical protein